MFYNNTIAQAPSKILEYVGTCKPIINIYTVNDDVCQSYLENYPLSISIQEDYGKIDQLASEIQQFIMENTGKRCEFDKVMALYENFSPEKFAEGLLELIT